MRKIKKIFQFFPVFILFILFSTIVLSNSCGFDQTDDSASQIIGETQVSQDLPQTIDSDETVKENTVTENTDKQDTDSTEYKSSDTKAVTPTIKLEIYEGPTYSQGDNVCYYRIEARTTGEPAPDVTFSKDDSNGAWGKYKVQVNLHPNETYTLTATAINPEGSDTDSIKLNWGCDLQESKITENVTDTSINNNTPIPNTVYSEQDLEYFFEIAFGAEYGKSTDVLHKWANNIRIKVNGMPTSADLYTLNQVISELNTLMSGISISIVSDNPNVEIYFTTLDQFPSIEPNYVPGNWGLFNVWWNTSGTINKGRILISSDKPNQQERSHLIREELTQSIGLMKDSLQYQESIFYQGWTDTVVYSQLDRTIISLLYEQNLKSGMTQEQVKKVFGIN